MNNKTVMVVAPIIYAACLLGSLFINAHVFVAVASVGAVLLAAVYVGLGMNRK